MEDGRFPFNAKEIKIICYDTNKGFQQNCNNLLLKII